jgi:hypothetical protein
VDHYLTADGIVVAQIDPREYEALSFSKLALADSRRYGNTMLCFYRRGNIVLQSCVALSP